MLTGVSLSEGVGKSKREAEQVAARTAYERLKAESEVELEG